MVDFKTTDIATLEYSGGSAAGETFFYGLEHSDHLHSAKFALDAHLRYGASHRLTMYRDYNISDEPVNLGPGENSEKWSIFTSYAAYDMCGPGRSCGGNCTPACLGAYPGWTWRQYPIRQLVQGTGWLGGLADKCLTAADPSLANGTPVEIATCADVPQQKWTVAGNQLPDAGTHKCAARTRGGTGKSTGVGVGDGVGNLNQRWTLGDNGTLRSPGAKCLDVRGADSTDGTPVQIYTGVPDRVSTAPTYDVLPQQSWTLRFGVVAGWTSGHDFSDSEANGQFGSASSYYDSFRLAD